MKNITSIYLKLAESLHDKPVSVGSKPETWNKYLNHIIEGKQLYMKLIVNFAGNFAIYIRIIVVFIMLDGQMEKIINKIINGDCELELKNIPDNSIDLIVTSPPYADKRKRFYDSIHPNKYVNWFIPIAFELKRVLKEDGAFILNIKEHPQNGERGTYVLELILELKKMGWLWIEEYCWYKKNSFPGRWNNRFRDSWERCLHFSKNKKIKMFQDSVKVPIGDWAEKRFKSMSENDFIRHVSETNGTLGRNVSNWLNRETVNPHNVLVFEEEHYLKGNFSDIESKKIPNLIEFATVCYNKKHSAAFPLELPTWFILLFTKKSDIVLDPFLGSGTTAVAAKLLGRKYIGIEKNTDFVEIANSSLKNIKLK